MLSSLRWLILPALAAGLLGVVPAPAKASKGSRPAFRVEDGAKMFSKEALDKADKKIEDIKNNYDRDLLIETYAAIPERLKANYKESEKERFFETWANKRYRDQDVHGVYVIICKNPTYLFAEIGKTTAQKAFTRANRGTLRDKMIADLKNNKPDQALLDAVNYVETTLDRNIGKVSRSATSGSAAPRSPVSKPKESWMNGIGGYICIGLVVILAVWLLFGLVRAFTGGGGRGGYGPGGGGGGGYGGGGGGGGGGGFFSSLMGGMFGAAAGMWMYDSFFRGGSSMGSWGSSAHAGDPTTSSRADDDSPVGGDGGGDWGGGTGGGDAGDAGGGGGDWGGGGGDTGGGGDWGGGGGDAGGGGDWGGGGGGGDFGGGGGDFGGGGGGGDW